MTRKCRHGVAQGILCCVLLCFSSPQQANAQAKQRLLGMSYPELHELPDWSGWWGLSDALIVELIRNPPPMKSDTFAKFRSAFSRDLDPDPGRYCRPSQFVGYSGGFTESVEFLFTPGRVTLTNEAGLIRRIYTDGRALPEHPDETNTGTSVGRWEDRTLVVETVGTNSKAKFPGRYAGAIPIGKNVRITERISLKDQNTLEFDVVTVAPEVLTAPDRRKRVYVRLPKQGATEVSFCVDFDRSIDPATGKQRFDMTPPADLAPPPH